MTETKEKHLRKKKTNWLKMEENTFNIDDWDKMQI